VECPQAWWIKTPPPLPDRVLRSNVPKGGRKIHIGIDQKTLKIRAIESTSSGIGDAPVLPDLLNQIPPDEEIGSVTADGAYDTRKCHDAIAARNAYAGIPPRKNAKLWKPPSHACWHALLGSGHARCEGAKRSSDILKKSWPCVVATVGRISPQEPRRNKDALC
jgi:hypothetical protein